MKCLIPVLAMIIFMIQIHAIFIMSPLEDNVDPNKDPETRSNIIFVMENNTSIEKVHRSIKMANSPNYDIEINDDEQSCTQFLVNCVCKCGLAFLAGILISDMKFIKFGVI